MKRAMSFVPRLLRHHDMSMVCDEHRLDAGIPCVHYTSSSVRTGMLPMSLFRRPFQILSLLKHLSVQLRLSSVLKTK